MKYACIARHRAEFPVRLMCRVLRVSPAGYYAWRRDRSPCARAIADERLLLAVRALHRRSHGRYGAPRVHRDLRAQGTRVAKKRVARLMRADGLVGRRAQRWIRTTDSRHADPVAPNLLARQCAPAQVAGVNRVWGSDLTYVPTREGWLYLAVVLDLGSRRCIGWATHTQLGVAVTLEALRMALAARRPPPGVIHHSDRGVQYASTAYRAMLAQHAMTPSMSRRGDCWDNAVVESFFATLKTELDAGRMWPSRAAARAAIARYIELWYNRQRRHSTLGYRSPVEYEAALAVA